MKRQSIERRIKEIAEGMGLSYMCESWYRANQALDRYRRGGHGGHLEHPDGLTLPVCLYVQPVAGTLHFTDSGFVRDAPSCSICFADEMPFDYKGAEVQRLAERLKGLAVKFIEAVNNSGYFAPVGGRVSYRVAFDKFDANLCIVTLSLTLEEAVGECVE